MGWWRHRARATVAAALASPWVHQVQQQFLHSRRHQLRPQHLRWQLRVRYRLQVLLHWCQLQVQSRRGHPQRGRRLVSTAAPDVTSTSAGSFPNERHSVRLSLAPWLLESLARRLEEAKASAGKGSGDLELGLVQVGPQSVKVHDIQCEGLPPFAIG